MHIVMNIGRTRLQAIVLLRRHTRNSRHTRLLAGHGGSLAIAANGFARHMGQVRGQPLAALRQGLGVGTHAHNIGLLACLV